MSVDSAIIVSGDLVISSGASSAGLLVEGLGFVVIENGGTLDASVATSQGMITVDAGGLLLNTDVEEDGFIVIDGTAEGLTARNSGQFQAYTGGALKDAMLEEGGQGVIGAGATAMDTNVAGGYFMLYGGTGEKTVVSSGGSFVVQLETGKANHTTVLKGGIMRLISAGAAEATTLSGGFLEVLGGSAAGTVLSGGSMRVNPGDSVQDTTVNDGRLELISATAIKTIVNGAEVRAVSASTLQDLTMNGGALTLEGGLLSSALVDSGAFLSVSGATISDLTMNDEFSLFFADASEMNDVTVNGGTGTFTGVTANGFAAGSEAIVDFDSASMIFGKAVFAEGATVALAGTTVTFDTNIATATEAQIKGLSAVTGDAVYTLNAGVDVGIYLLATDADEFNSDVVFGQYTLRLNEEPLKVGDLVYTLNLNAGVLDLTIEEYVPPTPGIVTLAYANSEWTGLADGTEVKIGSTMATIGTNAFATGDAATEAVAEVENGKVRVAGGTVNFAAGVTKNTTVYNGAVITNSDVAAGVTLVVNNGAKLTGNAAFAAGSIITINGTLEFDTQYTAPEKAQFSGFSAVSGNAKYTLNAVAVPGSYLLASDAAAFTGDVTFGDVTLTVGADPVVIDDFSYSLTITDNSELALIVVSVMPPELAYVNSEWSDKKDGDAIQISETVTATFGYDAFAALAPAEAAAAEDGAIEIVGGSISFADGYTKPITVDAGATVVGKAVFDKAITVDGTIAFDIANATAEKAQFGGFSFITGSTTTAYTLTAETPVIGTYLLASDAADFTGTVAFGDVALTVGAEPVKVGNFTYALSLTEGVLALDIAEYIPPTPTLAYVNSEWSGKLPGDTVQISGETVTATIGYDAFALLAPAEAAVTEDGAIEVVGGKVSFDEGYTKTITVDTGATVVGKAVFDKAITIDGTIAFDIAVATAEAAQFGGFAFITGSTSTAYTLTAEKPAVGTYLLASGLAAPFDATVAFGDVTLTVGAEPVAVGQFTYALTMTEGTLTLEIAKNIPTLAYVNSLWSALPAGSTVKVGEKNATIGYDAFAALAPAETAVTEDGAVEIAGGAISFAEGYTRTITVDAAATVVGKAVFDKAITVNGTIAFDIANATAEAAQFGGFSFISGTAAYTLTAAVPAVGTYLLATEVTAFTGTVKFGPGALTIGAAPTVIGDFTYALSLTEGTLALTIDEYVPPTPTLDLAYVNSKWSDKKEGDTVQISDTVTATVGVNAFASGDVAIANVLAEGTLEVVGGEVFFTNPVAKSVTIDAGATLIGKAAFTKAITVDGTVAFDTQYATAEAAQFTDFSFVTGSTSTVYTLTAANPVAGTYLLASNAAAFTGDVLFGNVTLTVGAEAVQVGDFTYALGITDNNDLALRVKSVEPDPPTPVLTLTYVNSEWAEKQPGDTVQISETVTATIGYDAFAALAPAEAAIPDDGAVEIVGGLISFAEGYSRTITVDADATVFGKAVFDKPITVNGTFAFDIANATAEEAQFGGFSFVTGSTTTAYTLTAAEPVIGTYMLASDAASFDSDVLFNDITLTVGAEPVQVGEFTLALNLTEGNLVLTIAEYIPPAPSLAYVNSEWAELEDGTTVQIGETGTATIGYDAFAALAPAEAAVTEDGAVEITGGSISFADGYTKTITVDAEAAVVGSAAFDKAITIEGTVAFDTQFATAETAQFGGFSFITGSTSTAYTLTDDAPAVGTYLLATDAAGFNSDVTFGDVTLTVGAEAVRVGDFTYALSLNEGVLALTVEEYIPPTPTLAYVNSEWAGLADKTVVTVGEKTAIIGYDAFSELATAIAAVTDTGAVEVAGGKVSFAQGYSKTITVDADATVVGKATFKTPITINGTIAFDTQYMTSAYAQFATFSNISGTPTYTLTDSIKAAGTYQLASGAKGFKGNIKFSVYTLKTGAAPIRVGNFTYAVSLMGGSLSLTVEKAKTPSSRPKLVYVNSEWANLASGTMVKVNSTTYATLGKDAFADGDTAVCTVSPKGGEIQIVGGSASFTEDASSIVVSSGAALNLDAPVNLTDVTIQNGGAMTAGSGALVNALEFEGSGASATVVMGGTVANTCVSDGAHITVSQGGLAKDIDLSGGDTAEEYGCLSVSKGGSASGITVSDGGSLTTDDGSYLTRLTVFGGQADIGGTATKVTLYDAMNVTGWGVVSKARVSDGGSIATSNTEDGVGSVLDSVILSGGIVRNAGFVSEIQVKDGGALETFDRGIAESVDVLAGGLFTISGSAAEACNLSLVEGGTVTVTDGAKLTGRITTEDGAFIEMADGTVLEFDLASLARPVDYALVSDFSAIAGLPDLVLSVSDAQEGGTYLLAGGADGFDRGIKFGEYTLTLDSEPVTIGSSTFSLILTDDGILTLNIKVPNYYVNTAWAEYEDGTVVTVDGVDAVIGVDAFATGDAAAAASPASARILVVGGTVSFTDGIVKQTVIRNGAELTNTDVYATLFLEDGAVLSGKSIIGDKAAVLGEGSIIFNSEYAEGGQPQFVGLSSVEGVPAYVLASGTTVGNYVFATDAADMRYQGIQVADGVTAYVSRAEFPVLKDAEGKQQFSYVFDVTKDNELTLSVVKVKNELDNGWNNYVYDKKTKVLNPLLDNFVSTALEDGVKGILLDDKGTVYSDGRRNYVGGIKGGATDEYDYAKITLEKSARLSLNLESTGAGKFTIWQLVEGTDKKGNVTYTMKSLQATTLKKDKVTGRYIASSKDLLIEAGDYYISMQATEAASKNGSYAFYNAEINCADDRTHFFADGDNGWNNYVYDKKTKELSPAAIDGDLLDNMVGKVGDVLQLDTPAAEFQLENRTLTNFVGFGDDADYAKLLLPYDSSLVFDVTATDAAKFTIWQLVADVDKKGTVTYKMKEIQTTALKKDKITGLYSVETKELRLNLDLTGQYYVSVQSTNASKGGSAYYSVVTSDKSIFYTDADNGWNDYVYDKKREEPLNKALYDSTGTYLYKKMGDIQLDVADTVSEQVGGTTFKNFVGYGDDADYLKITLANTSTLSFNVTATNAAKFVIYQLVEGVDKKGVTTYKMKEIQSTTLKKADKYAEFFTVTGGTKPTKALEAGDYYIAVIATNAKKGELAYYNVSLNDVGCSNLPDQPPQQPVEEENFTPAPEESEPGTLENNVFTNDSSELTTGPDSTEDNLEVFQTASAASPDLSVASIVDVQDSSKSALQAMLA